MKPASQSVEALFKLAGDTADLMVATSLPSRTGHVSQSLHNQLDIPEHTTLRGAQSAPAPINQVPIKKKRGRPPKIRPQENPEPIRAASPVVAPAPSTSQAPEVVIAHRSQHGNSTKRINLIHNPIPEPSMEKNPVVRSTRLATDGISYKQLAGTREYRKRGEAESADDSLSHDYISSGVVKRKYRLRKEKDLQPEANPAKKPAKLIVQPDYEQRPKRKYVKKSSKWKTLSQSSQLREENFLRAPSIDGTIRPTATRYDTSRGHSYPPLDSTYGGVQMPSIMSDSHMNHVGMSPSGHLPPYPIHPHPYMVPQYMHMHHPYAFGRYEYGVPPSITSMYAPRDVSDPYFPHSSLPPHNSFMHQSPDFEMGGSDTQMGHHRPAAPVPRVNAAAFRQHSSVHSNPARASNPVPDSPSDRCFTLDYRSGSAAPATSDRGSLKRSSRMNNDGRAAPFVELTVPDQPDNAIALLPPLTETSAFRHISKSHDEVTAQRRRRHKLDKLISGKPVLASSENVGMLSLPPVSLVSNSSDLYELRQLAPCSCKWTRSSYEQVLAQADALILSTVVQGKSPSGHQGDCAEPQSSAPLVSCFSAPAADSAVSFAFKLQQQNRSPEAVKEFVSATLTLLKREMGSLTQVLAGYSDASEKFRQQFDSEWNKAMSALNARIPIPQEFLARFQPEGNAGAGEAAGRDHKKFLWELFHQNMTDIVAAKNGLDVVMEGALQPAHLQLERNIVLPSCFTSTNLMQWAGMKSVHKMGKALPGVHSHSGDANERK